LRPLTTAIVASIALHAAFAALPLSGDGKRLGDTSAAGVPLRVAIDYRRQTAAGTSEERGADLLEAGYLPVPSRYYTSAEVDVKATPLGMKTRPRTSDNFPLGRIATVKLRLFINEHGELDSYRIIDAKHLPDRAALEDFREVRFRPAERAGRPVKSQKVVEISFIP
jgi:hypothetical protein